MAQISSTAQTDSLTRNAAKKLDRAATLKTSLTRAASMVAQPEGFLDAVAGLVVRLIDRAVSPRTYSLREDDHGNLIVNSATNPQQKGDSVGASEASSTAGAMAQLAGSRVDLMVSAEHCLFCPLDLPHRAAEFLSGIVRAQIDRLTPWHASELAFGFGAPAEIEGERLTVTIAAAPLTAIRPLLNSLFAKGARSVAVFVAAPEPEQAPIKIWEQRALNALQAGRIRTLLAAVLAGAALLACAGLAADAIGRAYLAADYERIDQGINRLRTAASGHPAFGTDANAQRALVQRKLSAPSTVLTIEALSKLLPDHTHVLELRLDDSKLRLVGQTGDAAALIGLIEQSGQFKRATFFAPTTRSASETGERFHIEATVQPLPAPRS
jgi:general secretion pathway protein L